MEKLQKDLDRVGEWATENHCHRVTTQLQLNKYYYYYYYYHQIRTLRIVSFTSSFSDKYYTRKYRSCALTQRIRVVVQTLQFPL
jgi:hypothetical protein